MNIFMQIVLAAWLIVALGYIFLCFLDGFARKREVFEALGVGILWPLVVIIAILAAFIRWLRHFRELPW